MRAQVPVFTSERFFLPLPALFLTRKMNSNSSSFGGKSSLTRAPSGGTIWGCYRARASASTPGEGGGGRGEAPLCSSPAPNGQDQAPQDTSAAKHKPGYHTVSSIPGLPETRGQAQRTYPCTWRTGGRSYAPACGHVLVPPGLTSLDLD